jgi:hypothetical protein
MTLIQVYAVNMTRNKVIFTSGNAKKAGLYAIYDLGISVSDPHFIFCHHF